MARDRGRFTKISYKHWHGVTWVEAAVTATQTALASFQKAEGDGPETLLRSRGNVLVTAIPDAGADNGVVGLGIVVANNPAITVGGVSLPGPLTDQGADWLWHFMVPLSAQGATAEAVNNIGTVMRVEIDSKAMRRVKDDQGLVLMAETTTALFPTVTVIGGWRFLMGS